MELRRRHVTTSYSVACRQACVVDGEIDAALASEIGTLLDRKLPLSKETHVLIIKVLATLATTLKRDYEIA